MHVKSGDEVLVIAGKEKGKRGKIKRAIPKENRVLIENLNIITRHAKARGRHSPGGRVETEGPIHASNVMLICPNCGQASRTGKRFLDEEDHKGRPFRKVRYCKSCDEVIEDEE
jgi:large subunit ribosomal protein L24